jgi:hypothetical protein
MPAAPVVIVAKFVVVFALSMHDRQRCRYVFVVVQFDASAVKRPRKKTNVGQ